MSEENVESVTDEETVSYEEYDPYIPSRHGKSTLYDYTAGVGNGH